FLAIRYDILPPEVCRELDNLFERVQPLPLGVARRIVEAETGTDLDQSFSYFEEQPLAAASVAQVHRAQTLAGDTVAVKLQRPGLAPIFNADIRNLTRIARLADVLGLFGRLSAVGMVREFARWTLRELDFTLEGRTTERVAANALHFEHVPRIHWDLTTPRMLTVEFVEGRSMADVADLLREGGIARVRARLPHFDLNTALRSMTAASLNQLFTSGFFHGDPHPGNVFVQPDSSITFLDFGIFGSLTTRQRQAA